MRAQPRAAVLVLLGAAGWASARDATTTPDDVRALVAEMLQDAATRSSLMDASPAAGHDGRAFFLAAPDGSFRLNFRAHIQFRYVMSFRNPNDGNGDGTQEEDFESGFQTRRTRYIADGNVWRKSFTYRVCGLMSRSTGDLVLEEAWAAHAWDNGLAVTAGQFKLPFLRERLVGSTNLLVMEYSSIDDAFTQDFSQGVQLSWTGENARAFGAFSDGLATRNSDFASRRQATSAGLLSRTNSGESDYAATGRIEFKHGDQWARFRTGQSEPGGSFACLFGAAAHVEGGDGSSSDFTSGTYLQALWTVDATVRGDGWVFTTAGVGSHSDLHGFAGGDVTNNDHGIVTEFAFRPAGGDFEPYFQHQALFPDPDRTGGGGVRAFNTFVLGMNYYLHGNAARFSADIVWRPDDTNPLVGRRTGSGYLTDDDPHEITLRVQWQLLF
jgi:hypothetical protein